MRCILLRAPSSTIVPVSLNTPLVIHFGSTPCYIVIVHGGALVEDLAMVGEREDTVNTVYGLAGPIGTNTCHNIIKSQEIMQLFPTLIIVFIDHFLFSHIFQVQASHPPSHSVAVQCRLVQNLKTLARNNCWQ